MVFPGEALDNRGTSPRIKYHAPTTKKANPAADPRPGVGRTRAAGQLYPACPPARAQQAVADVPSPPAWPTEGLERPRQDAGAKGRPAVVQVSGGSGVVIDADGLLTCAAHVGGHAGRPVMFVFPDGRRAHGVTLGNDKMGDAGLMRITDRGPGRTSRLPSQKTSSSVSGAWP